MLGGGGYTADKARLQRGLDAVDVAGTCATSGRRGNVTAYLAAGEPLLYVEVHDQCGEVWTPAGFVGVLRGAALETVT